MRTPTNPTTGDNGELHHLRNIIREFDELEDRITSLHERTLNVLADFEEAMTGSLNVAE